MADSNTYFARSASDRTDDWPFWFVAENSQPGVNVTYSLVEAMTGKTLRGFPLLPRGYAEVIADEANKSGVVLHG